MEEKNALTKCERIQEKIFVGLFISIFFVIVKGIINQSNNIDQDYILYPTFLVTSTIFCIMYSANAFMTGNLVRKWGNHILFNAIVEKVKMTYCVSEDKASKIATRVFGIFILILALICVASAWQSFHTGKY